MKPEDIVHRLAYYGEDSHLEGLIVEVVARLPEDVADFALERCRYMSVGESVFGMVLPGRIGVGWEGRVQGNPSEVLPDDAWLVVLADPLPEKDAHSIIAHEIAHAWRGDDRLSFCGDNVALEEATARLTAEWGFSGIGAEPENVTQQFK